MSSASTCPKKNRKSGRQKGRKKEENEIKCSELTPTAKS
jgi:hypothetical protein